MELTLELIVNWRNAPSYKLTKFYTQLLNQIIDLPLLNQIIDLPSALNIKKKNPAQLIYLKGVKIGANTRLSSPDTINLYSNLELKLI
jgi:hypothetical protein